jgi:hypothetical protein
MDDGASDPTESVSDAVQLIGIARAALESHDHDDAVVAAYAAARNHMTQETDLPDELTHREFLAAYGTHAGTAAIESFTVVADAYEQAVFTGSTDSETATAAVERAETIVTDS